MHTFVRVAGEVDETVRPPTLSNPLAFAPQPTYSAPQLK